jgi:hypothetical protein
MFYTLICYSNHVNEISYLLKLCHLYNTNLSGSQPEDAFMKKAETCRC